MQTTKTRLSKEEILQHLAKTYYHDPYGFVEDIIGVTPTKQQELVLNALTEGHHFISVKSGHGVGKTGLQAWIILWFLCTRKYPKLPVTAPAGRTLENVLWPEIYHWLNKSKVRFLLEWSKTRIQLRGHGENWFAVARSSNKPENMQGFHAENLMFDIEEASGVPNPILEVVEGALTTKNIYCLMFSNPTQTEGMFFESFHRQKKFWKRFTFSCLDSPLVTKEYVERMKAKWGEESDVYRVRVLGEFPKGAADAVFSIHEITEAQRRIVLKPSINTVELGVDVARFGDNKTVIAKKQGLHVTLEGEFYKQDTMTTTGKIVEIVRELEKEGKNVTIFLDDTGVGGGVTDRLNELVGEGVINAEIVPVNNGEKAYDDEHYANRGTECWHNLKEMIQDVQLPEGDEVLGQLTVRKKKMTSAGKIILERKEEMTKRGIASPDVADAIALLFTQRGGFSVLEGGEGVVF